MPILQNRKNFGLTKLYIDETILVPRSETELLVEKTLELISIHSLNDILELGTGSGAIAIAIASEKPMLNIKATDIKAAALKIAKHNSDSYKIKNIEFIKSDWFCNIKKYDYDLIVSNPPYIGNDDPCLKNSSIKFEPDSALISGQDGLDD